MIGKMIFRQRRVTGQVFDNLGNNIPCSLHLHPITGTHAQSCDLIAIVEGHVRDDDPTDSHRLQPPHRCQLASAAYLDIDCFQRRLRLLRRKFVRNSPARGLGDETQTLLPVEAVNFIDHTVDVIGQVCAEPLNIVILQQRARSTIDLLQEWRNRNAPFRNSLHDVKLVVRGHSARFTPAVR